MAKRKTLGQIMEDKYTACRSAGIDITESYERAASAVEREVLRRLECQYCTTQTPTDSRRWFRENCPYCNGDGKFHRGLGCSPNQRRRKASNE